MPNLAFRSSDEIIDPLFEQLAHPDESVSVVMLERLIPKLPFEYQKHVAYGITSLIKDDESRAITFFEMAIAASPTDQKKFVLSNAAASLGVSKRYSREIFFLKKSLSLNSPHLLKYASHIAARWCEFEMLKEIESKLLQLKPEGTLSDDEDINKMFNESREMLKVLSAASAGERESLKQAAGLVQQLTEQERIPVFNTQVWKDEEGCYCYAFYLHEDYHSRFRELDEKLDSLIMKSGLDYTHVTPVIFFGGVHAS